MLPVRCFPVSTSPTRSNPLDGRTRIPPYPGWCSIGPVARYRSTSYPLGRLAYVRGLASAITWSLGIGCRRVAPLIRLGSSAGPPGHRHSVASPRDRSLIQPPADWGPIRPHPVTRGPSLGCDQRPGQHAIGHRRKSSVTENETGRGWHPRDTTPVCLARSPAFPCRSGRVLARVLGVVWPSPITLAMGSGGWPRWRRPDGWGPRCRSVRSLGQGRLDGLTEIQIRRQRSVAAPGQQVPRD